ncbi:hypothetical protein DEO72_LG3g1357 [Vigna unguiculata]|uniref:Uncharacterized protein n=1 Tax=Vigna unguiculata TaxID=3917 RepID=A0A4D6LE05_VIGUN|nr:hypothetical protein DEO72_LG3g1357 [Vigna unguiculata]
MVTLRATFEVHRHFITSPCLPITWADQTQFVRQSVGVSNGGGLGRDGHKISCLSEPLRRKKRKGNSTATGISDSALCKGQWCRGGNLGRDGLSWQTRGRSGVVCNGGTPRFRELGSRRRGVQRPILRAGEKREGGRFRELGSRRRCFQWRLAAATLVVGILVAREKGGRVSLVK